MGHASLLHRLVEKRPQTLRFVGRTLLLLDNAELIEPGCGTCVNAGPRVTAWEPGTVMKPMEPRSGLPTIPLEPGGVV